jgi:hypothetical protein
MDRRAKLFLALATIAVSTIVLLARERGKSRNHQAFEANIREARISFEDFTATRYSDGRVTQLARAKSAYLLEPNMLELFGDVSVRSLRGKGKGEHWEQLYCETATAYFRSSNLSQMLTSSAMDHVDLRGFVKLEARNLTLETDYAVYNQVPGVLQSQSAVMVRGKGHYFKGDGGFTFDVRKENLNVAGPIRGGGQVEIP